MTNPEFEIKILRQHWIKDDGLDDKADLCSHGELYLKIGDEVLSDSESDSWCLSASGLYLLRTLKQDYSVGDFDNYLVPCCGHFMIPNDEKDYVLIFGCNNGIDWNVRHENKMIELTTEKGNKTKIPIEFYINQIIDFTDLVEQFYGNPNEKEVPKDDFDQNGFRQFWTEWKNLKAEFKKTAHNNV